MPHRRSAEAARQAIREAAVELFVGGGYGATSLEDIGRQVGITRQATLYHFRSKEVLLRSVVDPYLERLNAVLDGLEVDEPPTADQQRVAVTAIVDVLAEHRGVVSLLSRFTTASTIADLGPELTALGQRVRRMLVGSAPDHAERTRAVATTAALIGVTSNRAEVPMDTPDDRLVVVEAALAILHS